MADFNKRDFLLHNQILKSALFFLASQQRDSLSQNDLIRVVDALAADERLWDASRDTKIRSLDVDRDKKVLDFCSPKIFS